MPRNLFSRSIVLFVIASLGCGQAKQASVPSPPDRETASSEETSSVEKESAPAFSAPLTATAIEGTAESAFQQTLIAFQQGHLDAAFDFLPASYQGDVNDLVHEFAQKMDPELWSMSFGLMAKVGNLMKTKKAWFLNLDMLKRAPQFESIKPQWDAIASGINDVAKSDVAETSYLEHADVRVLLASCSRLLGGLPLPNFGDVQVTTLKSQADSATLSYRESKDAAVKEVEFVRIEGKWLPKSIATGWSEWMANARQTLSGLPEQVSSVKPSLMNKVEMIDGMLDQLQGTKSSEEFGQTIVPLFFSIALEAQKAQQSLRDGSVSSRRANAVHCIINRELTDEEQTQFKDAVVSAFGNPGFDYELIPNDGKTRCRFTPIADVDELVLVVNKHFQGASVILDGSTRTIRVEEKN